MRPGTCSDLEDFQFYVQILGFRINVYRPSIRKPVMPASQRVTRCQQRPGEKVQDQAQGEGFIRA